MRFLVGIEDHAVFGADLERALSAEYFISEFEIIKCPCGPRCTSVRSIAQQVDDILKGLLGRPAQYFVAIVNGRVEKRTIVGPIPYCVTAMTIIDAKGVILADRIEDKVGHCLPRDIRRRSSRGTPDLIDIICNELTGAIGTAPEAITLPLPHI